MSKVEFHSYLYMQSLHYKKFQSQTSYQQKGIGAGAQFAFLIFSLLLLCII